MMPIIQIHTPHGAAYVNVEHLTHLAPVEDEPEYVELFHLDGSRSIYHASQVRDLLRWFDQQARQWRKHLLLPKPVYDALDTLVAEEEARYGLETPPAP